MTLPRTHFASPLIRATGIALAMMLSVSEAPAQGGPQPERDAMLGFPRAPADQEWMESLRHGAWFGDARDPRARMFWSPDSTQLLLVPGPGDTAYVGTAEGAITHGVVKRLVVVGADRATMTSEALSSLVDRAGGAPIRIVAEPPLVGEMSADALLLGRPDYAARADAYAPRPEALARLAAVQGTVEVRVYFGTWDPASRDLVPGVLESARRIRDSEMIVRYFGLSEDMTQPADVIRGARIERVPAIVMRIDDVEIGRAGPDERPEEALARLATRR